MWCNNQIIASHGIVCDQEYPVVADPNAGSLVYWMTGQTVTNGSVILPRDGTLANTYAAHVGRYQTVGTFNQITATPYPCAGPGGTERTIDFIGTDTTNNLGIANTTALQLGGSNFTIECWLKFRSFPSSWAAIAVKGGGNNIAYVEWMFNANTSPTLSGFFGFTAYSSNTASGYFIGQTNDAYWGYPVLNAWTFVSVTRSGNNWYMHQDGALQRTFVTAGTIYSSTRALTIGYRASNVTGSTSPANKAVWMDGSLSDFKIYKGLAKYSSADYIPPKAPTLASA